MDTSLLARRMSQARRARGLTLQQVADAVGVARSTVQRYERGAIAAPRLPVVQAIAAALGVSAPWLLGQADAPGQPEDAELQEYLQQIKDRPEMRMLFSLTKDATKEDVERAVRIIEALRAGR